MSASSIVRTLAGREVGGTSKFPRASLSSCSSFISRLTEAAVLEGHQGCVNSINWNHDGSLIITGSDDCYVNIWHGNTYKQLKRIRTGHVRNIFAARFVPETNDTQFVSTGMDGQIRWLDIGAEVKSTRLDAHDHMVYKLIFVPDTPRVFLSTHQDSVVRLYDLRTNGPTQTLLDLRHLHLGEYGVNTLAFDPLGAHLFALGCSDPYLRVYDIRKPAGPTSVFCPAEIRQKAVSARERPFMPGYYITGVDWSCKGELAATYSREHVYTFDAAHTTDTDVPGLGRVCTAYSQKFLGSRNVRTFLKEVAFLGGDQYVATGSDCGHLYVWNCATGALAHCIRADAHVVNGVAPHPYLLKVATCGIDSEGKVWDVGTTVKFNEAAAKAAAERNAGGPGMSEDSDSEGGEITFNQLIQLLRRNPRAFRGEMGSQLLRLLRMQGEDSDEELGGEEDEEEEEEDDDEAQQGSSEDAEMRDAAPAAPRMSMEQIAAELDEVEREKDRGNELFRSDQWQPARETYTAALQRIGNIPQPPPTARLLRNRLAGLHLTVLMNRAAASVKLGNAEEAIVDCNAALDFDPENVKALYRRGCAYLLAGRFEEAEADAQHAIRLSPSSPELRRLLTAARAKNATQL